MPTTAILDRHVGDAFGFLKRAADGSDRGIEIDDQALARTLGLGRAHGQESRAAVFDIGNQRARLGAADIQRHQVPVFLGHSAAPCDSVTELYCAGSQ